MSNLFDPGIGQNPSARGHYLKLDTSISGEAQRLTILTDCLISKLGKCTEVPNFRNEARVQVSYTIQAELLFIYFLV